MKKRKERTPKAKKYTLCASLRQSFVKRGQMPYPSPRTRDEKGTSFVCRYQKELLYNVSGKEGTRTAH